MCLNHTKPRPLQTDRRKVERSMHNHRQQLILHSDCCIPDTTANDRTAVSALVTYSLMALCGGACCTAASTASALCSASWACICSVEMHIFACRPCSCSKKHFDADMLARSLHLQAFVTSQHQSVCAFAPVTTQQRLFCKNGHRHLVLFYQSYGRCNHTCQTGHDAH